MKPETSTGRTPLETPQHLVDKSIIGADDDKWLIYEVEEKSQPHHNVKLILLRNVDDYGVKGQGGSSSSKSIKKESAGGILQLTTSGGDSSFPPCSPKAPPPWFCFLLH